jgi:hypothetical protein
MDTYDLPDEELLEEESRPVKERILIALRLEGATIKQLQQITGASEGTIRNKLSELGDEVVGDGRRPTTYNLVSSSPEHPKGSDSDDTGNSTVSSLFANPPGWLVTQLEVYREDPAKHLKPLCAAVAAVILEDGARGDEVREEVENELERWEA